MSAHVKLQDKAQRSFKAESLCEDWSRQPSVDPWELEDSCMTQERPYVWHYKVEDLESLLGILQRAAVWTNVVEIWIGNV